MKSTKTFRRLDCFLNVAFSFSLILLLVHPAIGQTETDTPPAGDRLTLKRNGKEYNFCLLYTSPSPRDQRGSRMPSSA